MLTKLPMPLKLESKNLFKFDQRIKRHFKLYIHGARSKPIVQHRQHPRNSKCIEPLEGLLFIKLHDRRRRDQPVPEHRENVRPRHLSGVP